MLYLLMSHYLAIFAFFTYPLRIPIYVAGYKNVVIDLVIFSELRHSELNLFSGFVNPQHFVSDPNNSLRNQTIPCHLPLSKDYSQFYC